MHARATLSALLLSTIATVVAPSCFAADPAATPHVMLAPDDVQWGPSSPMLPPGSKSAVLYGDPTKPGLFIIRASLPGGYRIPAHSHPTDETVTVLSGTFLMGMGDALDPAKAKPLPVGGFAMMPAGAHHFAIARTATVVQIAAMGPLQFNYVNPRDDPRNAAK